MKKRTRSRSSCGGKPAKPRTTKRKTYPATPAGQVAQYCDDVLEGRRVAGRLERAAVRRHVTDLKTAKRRGLYFDEEIATRSCQFFGLINNTDGEWAGQPFDLKPIQRFIVWSLFGWRRASDGMRRFRRAFLSMARGNGKTYFAAALTLLLFAFDFPVEPRAECYAAATTRDQARQVFNDVKAIVEANPALRDLIQILKTNLSITRTGAKFEPLGGVGKVADGKRPHLIICDELHAWMEEHRDLWDKLTTAMGKRRQPLFVIITTAGSDESELWEEQYDIAVRVVDPDSPFELDDWFVFICEIDEGDDPFDERVWPKANPLLADGVIKIDEIRSLAKIARENEVEKNNFLRYRCNTKVTSLARLITAELWARGAGELPDLEDHAACGGIDLGWRDDLCAMALTFPLESVVVGDEQRRRYAFLCQCFIAERNKRNLADEPWASWIRDGWLTVTPGETTDMRSVYALADEWQRRFAIKSWAMDPNNCREFGTRMVNEHGTDAFWFGQSAGKYNEPTREMLAALRDGRVLHGNNPLLAWSMQNVVVSTDSRGYIKPEKRKSNEKIDAACAQLMSLSEILYCEPEPRATGFVGTA
jgi:phage terminase large subunit-like protein